MKMMRRMRYIKLMPVVEINRHEIHLGLIPFSFRTLSTKRRQKTRKQQRERKPKKKKRRNGNGEIMFTFNGSFPHEITFQELIHHWVVGFLFLFSGRWEEERYTDGSKWRFLEHKGPVFAPPYEPLPDKVKFYYDGQCVSLKIRFIFIVQGFNIYCFSFR